MQENIINSEEYWEHRFATKDWNYNGGAEQTAYFAELFFKYLPSKILLYISQQKTLCDWGCAEGQATNMFKSYFKSMEVIGIDISTSAIITASELYRDCKFLVIDLFNSNHKYDIIFTSNVLEHFEKPFDVLQKLATHTNKMLIAMIPFHEFERIDEHFYTFDYNNIPQKINNFQLVSYRVVDCEPKNGKTYWLGKQLMLFYIKNDDFEALDTSLELLALDEKTITEQNIIMWDYITSYANKENKLITINKQLSDITDKVNMVNELVTSANNKDMGLINNLLALRDIKITEIEKELYEQESKLNEKIIEIQKLNEQTLDLNNIILNMVNSKSWRITKPLRELKLIIRNKILNKRLKKIKQDEISDINSIESFDAEFNNIVKKINKDKKIAIIFSGVPFDEISNQRSINCAKYLSSQNYLVFFVTWQWSKSEISINDFQEVYNCVWQVPLYYFDLTKLHTIIGGLVIFTLPAEQLVNHYYILLRSKGYKIFYDIYDNWEEFCNVGQAVWYVKQIEEHLILNSDIVCAVSPFLINKFDYLDRDIVLSSNGYSVENVGKSNKNIARLKHDEIIVGYFGHLNSKWLDWELIFKISTIKNVHIEIIGYGADEELLKKMREYEISYIGTMPSNELYKYVKNWSFGLVPFINNDLSNSVDPIKIYEYLYYGLKVIASGIPHLQSYPNTILLDVNSMDLVMLDDVLNNDDLSATQEIIDDFLLEHTWDRQFSLVYSNLENDGVYRELYK